MKSERASRRSLSTAAKPTTTKRQLKRLMHSELTIQRQDLTQSSRLVRLGIDIAASDSL
jgi:hypothetical protein